MLGIIIGIALFFIGAMISNVFPSTEEDLTSYKTSAVIKLFGLGILTTSLIVGGLVVEGIDKNLKTFILLIGLIILILYTIASPMLEWNMNPSIFHSSSDATEYDTRPTGLGLPGFELPLAIGAISFVFLFLKRKSIKG